MNDTLNIVSTLSPKKVFDNNFPIELNWRVADLGCGTMAFFTIEAARRVGNKGEVYAVDVQKQVLAAVNQLTKTQGLYNVATVWSNVEIVGATNIPHESLDACFLVTTLYQVDDRAGAVKEASRLLKPGGKLLIIDWRTSNAPVAPQAERIINLEFLKNDIVQAGLIVVSDFQPTSFHFGMTVEKPLANN